jgi:hypothetical protein
MDEGDTAGLSNRWDNFLIELQPQQLIQIAFSGAVVGVVAWLMTLLVRQVVLVPLFCGDPASGACVGATDVAGYVATIIAGVVGLMGLVRIGAFRPLLIVIAAAISLWGMSSWASGMFWFTSLAWFVILYALTYTAFAWFARIRPFVPALVVVVVIVLLTRIFASV